MAIQLSGANNGALLTSLSVQDYVIDATSGSHINFLNQFRIIPTNDKYTKQLAETSSFIGAAAFVPEMTTVDTSSSANSFAEFDLYPKKRVAEAITVSRQMANDAAFDIDNHISNLLVEHISRAIERQILLDGVAYDSSTYKDANNLERLNYQADVTDGGTMSTPLAFENVQAAYKNMLKNNPKAKNAFWLFNSNSELSVLGKDGLEKLKFDYDDIPAGSGAQASLMGLPVYFTSMGTILRDGTNTRLILASRDAYIIAMSDIKVTKIKGDTVQEMQGSNTILAECYCDARVTNRNFCYVIEQAS